MKRNALCFAFAVVTFSGARAQDGEPQSSAKSGVAASILVTPTLDAPLDASRTTLWCSTFQLAWNELRDNVVKEDVRLTGGPAYVATLNAKPATTEDLASGSFVVASGLGRDGILEKIRKALSERFGAEAPPLNVDLGPNDLLVYAALQRHLPFALPFDRLPKPIAFRSGERSIDVAGFGVLGKTQTSMEFKKLAEQVDVLHYGGEADFVIRLRPREAGEEIILARITPGASFAETLSSLAPKMAAAPARPKQAALQSGDALQIPVIRLDVEKVFDDLVHKSFENAALKGMAITDARQHIAFQLDEKGADVRSEAQIKAKLAFDRSRRLICDGPFLLCLKRTAREQPYLVLWAGDDAAFARN